MEAKPHYTVPYMERGKKKKIFKKVVIHTFAVLIWCEKKKKVKNFLFWLAKDTLQESVVCKEEKLSLICIQKHCSYRVLVQERRNLLYFLILYSNRP